MTSVNGNGSAEKASMRLCHMIKWHDYDGYGFNLHAEKNKPVQFIGKIDEGSPAEAAGLREGDKIIEVNGTNITGDDHKSVVNKIKQKPNETSLLVVDKASAEYYAKNGVTISSAHPEVITMKTPPRSPKESSEKPTENGNVITAPGNGDVNGNQKEAETPEADKKSENTEVVVNSTPETIKTNGTQEEIKANRQTEINGKNDAQSNGPAAHGEKEIKTNGISEEDKINSNETTKPSSLASESPKSVKSMTSSEGGKEQKGKLNLSGISVEEFRNKLALKKKYDPKKENMDVKKKYEIIDQL